MTATTVRSSEPVYGVLAELSGPEALLAAIEKARTAGYTIIEAYTPYPIEAVAHAIGYPRSTLPKIVLAGGLVSGISGFLFQCWVSMHAYPMNVGGRPLFSWPAFIVPTFEMTILGAALSAVLGMFALNGLPQPYHPVFNIERFLAASRDSYFLLMLARDPKFDLTAVQAFVRGVGPVGQWDVPA